MRHLIKIALVLLAAVAAWLVFGFGSAVLPLPVAALSAGSLVATYIGLAFADIPHAQQARAIKVAWAAMVVEALYGTLYVLSIQFPGFFAQPPVWAAVPLAMLHGASFSVLAFFVSLFVFHGQREGSAVASPEERVALILAEALRPLVQPVEVPALPEPEPQASYARPAEVPAPEAAQPVLMLPSECPACGQEPTRMQLRTAAQHNGWCCKGCGKRVSPQ